MKGCAVTNGGDDYDVELASTNLVVDLEEHLKM